MPQRPSIHAMPCHAGKSHDVEFYDRRTRRADPGLRQASQIRNTAYWRKVRLAFISRHPVCANPHGVHGTYPPPAAEVHHIKSLQEAPELAFVWNNLMALCCSCHAIFSAKERAPHEKTAGQ